MTRIWRYDPEALDEAIEAAAYDDDQRPGLGGEFYGTLERTLDELAETPEHATRHPEAPPELGLVRFRVPRFPLRRRAVRGANREPRGGCVARAT